MKDDRRLSRRAFLGAGAALAGAPAILCARTRRPNILILMTDQQRFDTLGCYGARAIETPNLDGLAARGVLFERCYVNNPVCTPSRASMMTGKGLPGHGVYRLYDNLPESEVLFTRRLQQNGYRTALFGKLHVSSRLYEAARRHPNDGFDLYEWCMEPSLHLDSPWNAYRQWLEKKNPNHLADLRAKGRKLTHAPREVHMTHWAAERTIDFIQSAKEDEPFFCLMSIFDPHNPYDGYPVEMREGVKRDLLPQPVPAAGDMARKPYGVRQEHEHNYLGAFRNFSRADLMEMRLGYYAAIALADQEFGRVLKALDAKRIVENTLVVFTSDHGDMLGDHGLLVKGAHFYDGGVRVPLLMRWPGRMREGMRIRRPVQLHDLAATVLAAAGCLPEETRKQMPESQDLSPASAGDAARLRDYAVCCYRNTGILDNQVYPNPEIHATMFLDERYKLNVYHAPPGADGEPEGQLFDMVQDPQEQRDLWNDKNAREVRLRMTERLLAWLASQERQFGSRGGEMLPQATQKLDNRLR
jgi:arylsulfatase A-like enzyme